MLKFTFELKLEVPEEAVPAFRESMREHARTMLAMATLASFGKRKPSVMLKSDDFFTDTQDIEIFDDPDKVEAVS